jgi:hypothetical protein
MSQDIEDLWKEELKLFRRSYTYMYTHIALSEAAAINAQRASRLEAWVQLGFP